MGSALWAPAPGDLMGAASILRRPGILALPVGLRPVAPCLPGGPCPEKIGYGARLSPYLLASPAHRDAPLGDRPGDHVPDQRVAYHGHRYGNQPDPSPHPPPEISGHAGHPGPPAHLRHLLRNRGAHLPRRPQDLRSPGGAPPRQLRSPCAAPSQRIASPRAHRDLAARCRVAPSTSLPLCRIPSTSTEGMRLATRTGMAETASAILLGVGLPLAPDLRSRHEVCPRLPLPPRRPPPP